VTGVICQLSGPAGELWQLPEDSSAFSEAWPAREELAGPQLAKVQRGND
jgi:hypothetical protein